MYKDEKGQRDISLDVLRIFCCYCIIMLHVSGHLNYDSIFHLLVQGVVRPALWCFMSLSGYLILSRRIENWFEFYWNHLLHIFVPLIIYTSVYVWYYTKKIVIPIKTVLAGDTIGHLWFVYALVALYFLAPFLQNMLIGLTNGKVFLLLIIMFFWGRVVNLLSFLGIEIGIPTEILGDCSLFFFVLGYWLSRNDLVSYSRYIIPVGIINIFYIAFSMMNCYLIDGATTLSLGMVVGTVWYFVLFKRIFNNEDISRRFKKMEKLISFLAARTYGIYLIHMLIFNIFTENEILPLNSGSISRFYILPIKCFFIFCLGLVCATVLDVIICIPIQKGGYFLQKIMKRMIFRIKLQL